MPPAPRRRRGFKALKQIIKIEARLGRHDEMVAAYRRLLDYSAVVTRNAAEKKINSVLDFVSAQATDSQLLQARAARGGGVVGRRGPPLPFIAAAGAAAGTAAPLPEPLPFSPARPAQTRPTLHFTGHPCHPPLHPPLPPQDFYSLTLDSMAEAKNERLWFKTNVKLANLLVSLREGAKAAKVRAPPGGRAGGRRMAAVG